MTYHDRIRKAVRAAILEHREIVDSVLTELQHELYLVDHCLAMVDPSQPEFAGMCPICEADVTNTSTETHRENCVLVNVIPEGEPTSANHYTATQDRYTKRWYAVVRKYGDGDEHTIGIDMDGREFEGIAVGIDRAFSSEHDARVAIRKHRELRSR